MKHFYESTLIDTTDGLQCKVCANDHPDGAVIARPKYVPQDKVAPGGMVSRFVFGRAMTRFNPFAPKKILIPYLKSLKHAHPHYFYKSPMHNRWFFAVPKNKIAKIHDSRQGAKDLLNLKEQELDRYLALVRKLLEFIMKSGVGARALGLTNSTLLGNYTFGRSDIDIVAFGKRNGWRIMKFLDGHKHPLLRWKSEKEWRKYHKTHRASPGFSENDFVYHNLRKRNEGIFGGHVFTVFTAEEPNERWSRWGEERYLALGAAKLQALVTDDYNSVVRPAMYKISNCKVLRCDARQPKLPVKQIVTYSMPFMLQAKKGERVEARGLLEVAVPRRGGKFLRLVVGYPEIVPSDDKNEYIKVIR